MKYLTVATLLLASIQLGLAAPSDKVDCSKVDEVLDDQGLKQSITLLSEKYKLATTDEDLVRRCGEIADAIKTLRKYNKECFSSLTQQVFSSILKTRTENKDKICNNPSEAKEAVAAMKCLSENSYEKTKEAERKAILTFQGLYDANVPDEKLRVRRSCCAILDAKKLFMDSVKEKCSSHDRIYTEYIDSYTSESMGLICPENDKLECSKLEPISIVGVKAKTDFFVNPMIKLVKTLDH